MRYQQHRVPARGDGVEGEVHVLGIELGEALVEDEDVRLLEERAGEEEAAPLAVESCQPVSPTAWSRPEGMRSSVPPSPSSRSKLSARAKSSSLGGHAAPISRLNATVPSARWFSWNCGTSTTRRRQPVEAEGVQIEPVEQDHARLRRPQPGEQCRQRRLSAPRRSLQDDPFARRHRRAAAAKNRFRAPE